MPHLEPLQWIVLCVGAAVAGFSKTAIGGAGVLAAALFALVLPARESTGLLLPLLICGDAAGVTIYRREANWRLIARLSPWMLAGIGLGVAFLARVRGNDAVRVSIGTMILVILAAQVAIGGRLKRRLGAGGPAGRVTPAQRAAAALAGTGAGFATMVANAAGAIMTVYLLLAGVAMLEFLGTGAWFFALVNLLKLPFSIGLGLVQVTSLRLDLVLLPALAVGAGLGVLLIRRMRPQVFERAALGAAAVSAVFLLV